MTPNIFLRIPGRPATLSTAPVAWAALVSISALAALAALGGCTTAELYGEARGIQRYQCQKLADRDERMRCEKSSNMSYDKYRSQAEASRGVNEPTLVPVAKAASAAAGASTAP